MFKQGWVVSFFFIGMFCGASNVLASAIGAPETYEQWGAGVSFTLMDVNEPKGETEDPLVVSPVNLMYINRTISGNSYIIEGFFQEATLDASPTEIGQEVERLGLRASLLKSVKPELIEGLLVGGGMYLTREAYTARHKVDSDGFLLEKFSDRKEVILGFQAELMKSWSIREDWDFSLRALYEVPVGDGASGLVISAYILRTRW